MGCTSSLQYGVELDVPAATILSVFGLRAQVRYHPLESFLIQRFLNLFFSIVILVAKHLITGHFLCVIHNSKLYHSTLLRKGEALGFGPTLDRRCIYIHE